MLLEMLLRACRDAPKRTAVDDGMRRLSYRRLTLLAKTIARICRDGTECDKVGILLPASAAFPATLFGAVWSQKIAVPLNFLLSPEELAKIVTDAGLDLIVTISHFEELVSGLPARAVFLDRMSLSRRMMWSMLRRFPPPTNAAPDQTAILLYTSGTTSQPKGVELTHGNLHSNCVDTWHSLDVSGTQSFLNVLPPFHVFGITGNVLLPIHLAATVFALPRFSPTAMVKTLREKRPTLLLAIPSMYAAVLRLKNAPADAFRSVGLAMSGGEPLPDSVRVRFEERFGLTLREGYGLTETAPVISISSPAMTKAGSVGRPIRNVTVRIQRDDGSEVATGGDGEIVVRGPGVMKGYYAKPEETARIKTADGWFHTGDIGRIDEEGFLFITGRIKDMMIVGGENVFPREIEAALEQHESVVQAAVIGMPDDVRGEVPIAFVIPASGAELSEQELRAFVKKSVAGFKVPRRIEIREDLPTGPTGKILKRELRRMAGRDDATR